MSGKLKVEFEDETAEDLFRDWLDEEGIESFYGFVDSVFEEEDGYTYSIDYDDETNTISVIKDKGDESEDSLASVDENEE
jgi:hypothetical protein